MPKPDPIIEIFLQPGELYFGDRHIRIRTLLGSCVSLVFWHPRRQIGGMCHYLLPSRKRPVKALDGRYGDEAIALMLREIRAAGAEPRDFHVRLFGGGNMFPGVSRPRANPVGSKNVQAARTLLHAYQLVVRDEHVEGEGHRSLVFDIWNGHVSLKHLPLHPGAGKR
jgi:chemotaxis protein CheD